VPRRVSPHTLPGSLDHRRRLLAARCAPAATLARRLGARLGLVVAGTVARPRRRRRRARLEAELRALGPAPGPVPTVEVIVPGVPGPDDPAHDALGTELVCVVATDLVTVDEAWLARLAAPLGGRTVATVPTVLHPARPGGRATPHDLAVREAGLRARAGRGGEPRLEAVASGRVPDVTRAPRPVDAGGTCLLTTRAAYELVGGARDLVDARASVVDLALRLGAGPGSIAAVPDALVVDPSPVPSVAALRTPLGPSAPAWRELVGRHGPALRRASAGPSERPRIALTTAAPAGLLARRWGDWELASGMARSLARLDVVPRVQTREQLDDPASRAADVQVVLRGLRPFARTSGQAHVLWVISHPDDVGEDELDEADLVLAASDELAGRLAARTATPVEVLLQGTDHRRFRPRRPRRAHTHPVTVVANTRGVLRPAVALALEAGVRPAIYGDGWERFVDPALVVTRRVPNSRLPVVYASAGVVLNDHWSTMAGSGMVSNRVYDVLACGTPLVSDHLGALEAQFGDLVPTYTDAASLGGAVASVLADPAAARRRAALARQVVLAEHTLDHRARHLLRLLRSHDLLPER
jgi:hypothetical protein